MYRCCTGLHVTSKLIAIFRPAADRGVKLFEQRAHLYVCPQAYLKNHMFINFTKFSMRVACDHYSVSFGNVRYVMYFRFLDDVMFAIMASHRECKKAMLKMTHQSAALMATFGDNDCLTALFASVVHCGRPLLSPSKHKILN